MYSIILGWIQLVRLCLSNKPEWAEGRKDLEDYYHHRIERPFMAGYNGEPDTAPQPKRLSVGAFLLMLILTGIGTYVFFWLLRVCVPSLWGS
jgi:hypothetical protein